MESQPPRNGPDPARIEQLDDLARELGLLRSRAARGTRSARIGLDDLVVRVGEPRSTVHAYLTGRRLAPAQVLDRIVIALGASPAEQRDWADAWDRVSAYRDAHRSHQPAPREAREAPAREPVLHQLPQAIDTFTGRLEQLTELDLLLSRRHGGVIAAVCGTAGVGKTALAVHWAQTRSEKFPDGQLYLDLRGFDPDQPVQPAQALAIFLRALGVPATAMPGEPAELAALYRSMLSGRRMLIMLDNARDVEQIRPLLPGDTSCSVLVTSRDSLTGLIARHGAHRVEVPALPSTEAVSLLGSLISPELLCNIDQLEALAELCARLPLALRIAAELATSGTGRSLEALIEQLDASPQRLDLLDAVDDPHTAIRAVLSWSYRLLPADAALAFRRIGLHPGPELSAQALAVLTDGSIVEARRLLGVLVRGHLMEQPAPDRYRVNRLLRDYAHELTLATDPEPERWLAETRLLDHYLHTAAAAMDLAYPARRHQRPLLPGWAQTDWLDGVVGARDWLDAERDNLVAAAAQAGRKGWPRHAIRIAQVVAHYLDEGGHHQQALTVHRSAHAAALACEDQLAEAASLNQLGVACAQLGMPDEAANLQRALAIYLELGDRAGQGRVLGNLGHVYRRLNRHREAYDHYRRHLEIHQQTGDLTEQAIALDSMADLLLWQANYSEAGRHYQRSLAIWHDNGDLLGQARASAKLAEAQLRSGSYSEAAASRQLALQRYQQAGRPANTVTTLAELDGDTAEHAAPGHLPQAAGD